MSELNDLSRIMATSAQHSAGEELPARLADDRESWLTFSLLLSSQSSVDPAALTEGIARRIRQRKRARMTGLFGLAVAASLLLAWGFWSWNRAGTTLAARPQPVPAGGSATGEASAIGEATSSAARQSAAASPGDASAWSDGWDDALAEVAGDVAAVESAWRQRPNAADAVQSKLNWLESELQDNAL